mmetsp:Transcript_60004/g.72110  ORF Transcript_60004/g.72110 Transcript_60004/m.72110 type:complete len:119 (-) Transcript_60004:76-432(-)
MEQVTLLLNRFGYSPATPASCSKTNNNSSGDTNVDTDTHNNHPDPQPTSASIVMTPLPKRRDVHYNVSNKNNKSTNTIRVNDKRNGYDIRQPNDLYGRYMTTWRKMHTEDDTEPFPTL